MIEQNALNAMLKSIASEYQSAKKPDFHAAGNLRVHLERYSPIDQTFILFKAYKKINTLIERDKPNLGFSAQKTIKKICDNLAKAFFGMNFGELVTALQWQNAEINNTIKELTNFNKFLEQENVQKLFESKNMPLEVTAATIKTFAYNPESPFYALMKYLKGSINQGETDISTKKSQLQELLATKDAVKQYTKTCASITQILLPAKEKLDENLNALKDCLDTLETMDVDYIKQLEGKANAKQRSFKSLFESEYERGIIGRAQASAKNELGRLNSQFDGLLSQLKDLGASIPDLLPKNLSDKIGVVQKPIEQFPSQIEERRAELEANITKRKNDALATLLKTAIISENNPYYKDFTQIDWDISQISKAKEAYSNLVADANFEVLNLECAEITLQDIKKIELACSRFKDYYEKIYDYVSNKDTYLKMADSFAATPKLAPVTGMALKPTR